MRFRKVVLLGCAALAGTACRKAGPPIPMPDWQYEMMRKPEQWLAEPGVELLRQYVMIDTSNPPGKERAGAEFLKEYLDCEGIPSELVCAEKDRCSLYSRLPGREAGRGFLLLNHIDVVPAYAPYWTQPPFGGVIHDGYLYGRGSYDMKSTGIAQLLAYVDLWHSGIRPARDVVFFAECGEETFGTDGAGWVFEHRPELFEGINFVLGEGGYDEVVTGELRYWGLEVGQAGFAFSWLCADDPEALGRNKGYKDLGLYVAPEQAVRRYFDGIAEFRSAYPAYILRHPNLLKHPGVRMWIPARETSLVTGAAGYMPSYRAALTPGFDFGKTWNAALALSVPLGVDPGPQLEILVEKARRDGIAAEGRYVGPPGVVSPYPTPATEALRRVIEAAHPGLPFLPTVSSFVSTTSEEFRKRGIPAYGFMPMRVAPAEAARRHGNDERIFLPFYVRGLPVMREAVYELAESE